MLDICKGHDTMFFMEVKQSKQFVKWYKGIKDVKLRTNIARRILRLWTDDLGDFKSLHSNILELRIHLGAGYRIYFSKNKENYFLLIGSDKKTQKRAIERAIKINKE